MKKTSFIMGILLMTVSVFAQSQESDPQSQQAFKVKRSSSGTESVEYSGRPARVQSKTESTDNQGRKKMIYQILPESTTKAIRVESMITTDTLGNQEEIVTKETSADEFVVELMEGKTQQDLESFLRTIGVSVKHRIPHSNHYLVTFISDNPDKYTQIQNSLQSRPDLIKFTIENEITHPNAVPNDPLLQQSLTGSTSYSSISKYKKIGMPEAWDVTTGSKDVLIGVLDVGVDFDHPDLKDNIWTNPGESGLDTSGKDKATNGIDDDGNGYIDDLHGWNLTNNNNVVGPRFSELGNNGNHGTGTSGVIGAKGNNQIGSSGINQKVSIVCLSTRGYLSDILASIKYAESIGCKIINYSMGAVSIGSPESNMPYYRGVFNDYLKYGGVFINSGGNFNLPIQGIDTIPTSATFGQSRYTVPACYDTPGHVVVGAMEYFSDDLKWGWSSKSTGRNGSGSNYGKNKMHLFAPMYVYSTSVNTSNQHIYNTFAGTSCSSPIVAGSFALLKSARPDMSLMQIRDVIYATVDKFPTIQNQCTTGGRLNIFKALQTLQAAPATNIKPNTPVISTVKQPSGTVKTGSVTFSGLPSQGGWLVKSTPEDMKLPGTGTAAILSGLRPGVYTFTVTDSVGLVSDASVSVTIGANIPSISAPVVGTITNPDCVSTGSVVLSGLPATGTWTLTRTPDNVVTTGTGTATTVTGLGAGSFQFKVKNAQGVESPLSSVVKITYATLTKPTINQVIQPTATVSTGSVVLSGLPTVSAGTNWTVVVNTIGTTITGNTSTVTIPNLLPGSYTFTVKYGSCATATSDAVVINAVAVSVSAPVVGTITNPDCISTGSVSLSGLPATGTWTLTRTPDNVITTGTGTATTVTGLGAGSYQFKVKNVQGVESALSSVVNLTYAQLTKPTINQVIQPTSTVNTGSVVLGGLPAVSAGTNWTVVVNTIGTTITGNTSTVTIPNLQPGSYTFTVSYGSCSTATTDAVVINAYSTSIPAPVIGAITAADCNGTGSVALSGLPATGTWTLTRTPDNVITTGTGATAVITGLGAGSYQFIVADDQGHTSTLSATAKVVFVAVATPIVDQVIQPTATVSTGSVVLKGLPIVAPGTTWTVIINPWGTKVTGNTETATISGIAPSGVNFSVKYGNCTSGKSTFVSIKKYVAPLNPLDTPTSVDEQQTSTTIYPNPVSNELFINRPAGSASASFAIINSFGQVVTNGVITDKAVVETSTLPDGVYVLRIADETSIKFIKNSK
jgi:hypothetical protein